MSTVSVVVIGRNEGERLCRCLQSVFSAQMQCAAMASGGPGADSRLRVPPAAQTRIEGDPSGPIRGSVSRPAAAGPVVIVDVIYVDSGSADGSVALAESLGARAIALHPARPTAALGRNAGWQAASGEYVLFLDGDTELAPAFVPQAVPAFASPEVAVVWGHRREKHPERSIYDRVLDLDWVYPPGPAAFCGGDALFRRDILRLTGGFDETLVAGEEPELCARILAQGYGVLHVDLPMTLHELAIHSLGAYWKRATRAGHAYAEVAVRFAGTANPLWSADLRRNRVRAAALVVLPLAALLAGLLLGSVWPFAAALCGLALLAVRTAWKARWKSRSAVTLLLYGVHSHFQQVPIVWGQWQFARNRRRGRQAALFDYKRPGA